MKLLLSISYDGTDYNGWIIQPKVKTIQGELTKAISLVTKTNNFKLMGASKTDSGVHALDQKVLLEIEFKPELSRFQRAINNALPSDIILNSIDFVDDDFSIRNVKQKQYVYTINDRNTNIFDQRFELNLKDFKIDIKRLQDILNLFVGKHDFKLFSGLTLDEQLTINTIRTIDSIKVIDQDSKIKIIFEAKSFIRYQIRMIVGASLHCLQNKRITIEQIKEKLNGIGEKSTIVIDSKGLVLQHITF
ncbi:tRNA pseudouridine(38-40) synthase TruA [Mesoplasma photuris]|uniref:tRNA pseudouridine(38-40) synthase TruA n=1 Tax=Mesoplasma photuris TaxID=217731 RepID=UPI0004E1313A|nr:tRNA pseudouridine(38-40) synthase TruA [Mesoplasma photuris]